VRTLLLVAVGSLLALPLPSSPADWDRPGWQLTFHDEFDGGQLDSSRWRMRYKWGAAQVNDELQAYVDDAFEVKNGVLAIVGERRSSEYAGQAFSYTSGVLCSALEQRYGYFEARLRVPAGRGLWPAFWLLGQNGAPGVNEVDIHEILGDAPDRIYMTVHWGSDYAAGHEKDQTSWLGPDFSAGFHVFGLEWTPDALVWTIDGVERKRYAGPGVPHVPMYLVLNLAIGGRMPGLPDGATPIPARYEIDYVRAYARPSDAGGPHPDCGSGAGGGAPPPLTAR
jgi:beta-glucanase (GH16 family)